MFILFFIFLIFYTLFLRVVFSASQIYWSWKNIKGSFRRVYQTIKWGWNETDIWGLDSTVCEFVIPRLKLLKENKHGIPGDFSIDQYYEYESKENIKKQEEYIKKYLPYKVKNRKLTFDKDSVNAWNNVMDKMIWSFQFILDDDANCYNEDELAKYLGIKVKKAKTKKGKHKRFWKIHNEANRRVEEGLSLFAKYFQNLWD